MGVSYGTDIVVGFLEEVSEDKDSYLLELSGKEDIFDADCEDVPGTKHLSFYLGGNMMSSPLVFGVIIKGSVLRNDPRTSESLIELNDYNDKTTWLMIDSLDEWKDIFGTKEMSTYIVNNVS